MDTDKVFIDMTPNIKIEPDLQIKDEPEEIEDVPPSYDDNEDAGHEFYNVEVKLEEGTEEMYPENSAEICPHCRDPFDDQSAFDHMITYHSNLLSQPTEDPSKDSSKVYQCPYCRYTNTVHKAISAHIVMKHVKSCEYCTFRTSNDNQYKQHVILEHNKIVHCCGHCGLTSTNPEELKSHVTTKHSYKCPYCKFGGTTSEMLQHHIISIHSYQCPHCDFISAYKSTLRNHIGIKHGIQDDKEVQCPFCEIKCTKGEKLVNHIMVNHKSFKCKLCNFICQRKTLMQEHMKNDHWGTGSDRPNIVYKTSRQEPVAITPQVEHLGKKRRAETRKQSTSQDSIEEANTDKRVNSICLGELSEETVVKEPPWKKVKHSCSILERKKNNKEVDVIDDADKVSVINNKTYKYKCAWCDFNTDDAEDGLKQHIMSVHAHQCPECSFVAATPGLVKKHISTRHMFSKTYRCPACHFVAGSAALVKRHFKTVH